MKKLAKVLLAVVVAVCAVAAAACGKGGVKLVDFPETATENVELGDIYTITLKEVKDEEGNAYRVSASVKTKVGGAVSVFESQFNITDMEGYVITYTAEIDEKTEKTSVVTLNVTDNGDPVIVISKPSTGEVNKLYTLPGIVVSDLSGKPVTTTVEVFFLDGETETKAEGLTENGGTYTFTPSTAGIYRIKVTASDAFGNSAVATSDFTVDNAVAEGTIFDPASLSAMEQIKTSTSCPAEIKAGDENADYTGAYVSFTSTETRWHNIFLTPKFDLGEYAEYDLAEVWLYADAKDGTEVGFSFFNDVNYNFRFPSDTWTKITLDMEDFIAKMGENNAIFLPFNTNNPSSTNHASLTELRLGGVFAKYAVEYSVEAEGLNIAPGAEQAEVSLTVASDRSALPAFSLTVTKDGREIPPASSESNVFGYTLSAGSYEYRVVSRDDMYRGELTGTFIVDYATRIILPETENAVAGTGYDIPDATLYVNGELSAEKANIAATFTAKYGGKKLTGIAAKGFVAPSSGVIEVTYSYEGAVSKTMEITVERAPVSQKHALDFSSSDVLENIQVAGGNNVLTYVEGETPYVSWTIKDNAVATWQMFKVNSSLSAETLAEYDYVRVKAMALSDDGVYRWRLLMCSDQYIAGDSEWNAPTRLALNEWGYIYVPMSAFLSGGNGFDKKCFVSVTFNKPQDGNADNVKEVRFADFELVKAAEGELLTEKTSYTTEENPSFTANVSPELAFKVEIRKNGEAVAALENVGGKYVWEGAKEPGAYEAVIVLTEGGYKLDGEYSVNFSVVEDTPAEDNAVFEPTEDSLAAQITTSKACAIQVKSGDPEATYTGNYVSFSGAANNAWVNISLKAKGSFEEYGKYDVVEIWLYADAKDGDTVKFSFFNDLAYQKTFPADTWTKISIPAADFVAKMSKSTVFLPFNYNNANSENHASLTELRLGGVYARYSVEYTVKTEGLTIAEGDAADVAITVSGAETLPAYTLTVEKGGVAVNPVSQDGNAFRYSLAAGEYGYTVVSADPLYSGETKGTFTVDYATKIVLPEAGSAVAGAAFDIPEAQVYVNGAASGNKAAAAAVYTSVYGAEKEQSVPLTGFVAPSAGRIVVTYTYDGALTKTLEIPVSRKPVSATHALDLSSVDVLGDIQVASGNVVKYVADGGDTPYISWSVKDNGLAKWQMFRVQSALSAEDLGAYAYVKVRVMAVSDGGEYKWRLLMCSDKFIVGEDKNPADEYQSEARLSLNEWHNVYIPMSAFLEGGNGFGNKLISVTFNAPGDGNADNVREVRFADFELVNEVGA